MPGVKMRAWWLLLPAVGLVALIFAGFVRILAMCAGRSEALSSRMPRHEMLEHGVGKGVVQAALRIQSERIRTLIARLQGLAERSSWENQRAASELILRQMQAMGLQPVIQEYLQEELAFRNIVVSFPGLARPDRSLMAVAHYDSNNWVRGKAAPGADDNATGVSVLLELASVLADLPRRHTWELVLFSNEEQGRQGSRYFAHKARQEGRDIAGVVAVDVVGYRPHGISELFQLVGSSLGGARKIKGMAKVLFNGYHALRNGCTPLQMAFRSEDLSLAPPAQVRKALGGHILWQLGGPCP